MESLAQDNEDIFLSHVLNSISKNTEFKGKKFLCEFGAHDGVSNSNLRRLNDLGWPLIFIEADKHRYCDLQQNILSDSIILLHEFVGVAQNTLGEILVRHNIDPQEVTVVSIDIDGDDLRVLESIDWELDLLVIEYNPTIPFDTRFINPMGYNFGNSALSIVEAASSMNLFLIYISETNLIFLNRKYYKHSDEIKLDNTKLLHQLRFALAYDGSVILCNRNGENFTKEILPIGWSKTPWVQPIPRYFRRFKKFERTKILFGLSQIILRPDSWVEVFRYFRRQYGRSRK